MTRGVIGNKTIFTVGPRACETTAVPLGSKVPLVLAEALIKSGQATPVAASYIAQFPWTVPPK